MKKDKLFLLILAFFCSSCLRNGMLETYEVKINFEMLEPGLQKSRVQTDVNYQTTFNENDAVGIFAFICNEDGSDGECLASNTQYTYNGSSWIPTEGDDIMVSFNVHKSLKLNLYAYYPYKEGIVSYKEINHQVATDQKNNNGYNQSDLIIAKQLSYEVSKENTVVPLTYSHALSMIELNIVGSEAIYTDDLSVKLCGLKSSCKYDIHTGNIAFDDEQEINEVEMLPVKTMQGNMIYRALLPPQVFLSGSTLIKISKQETEKIFKVGDYDINLNPGKIRSLKVQTGDDVFEVVLDNGDKDIIWDSNSAVDDNISLSGMEVSEVQMNFDTETTFPNYDYAASYDGKGWWKKSHAKEPVEGNVSTELEVVVEKNDIFGELVIKINADIRRSYGYGIGYNCPDGKYSGRYKLEFDAAVSNSSRKNMFIIVSSKSENGNIYFPIYDSTGSTCYISNKIYGDNALGIKYESMVDINELNVENRKHELIVDLGKKYPGNNSENPEIYDGEITNLTIRFCPESKNLMYISNIKFKSI